MISDLLKKARACMHGHSFLQPYSILTFKVWRFSKKNLSMTYNQCIHIMIYFHHPHHFTSDLLRGWSPRSSISACSHDGTSLRIRSCYDPEASGEHTLDQPTRGQIVGTPYEAIMRSMSDIYVVTWEWLSMPDVAQLCQTWPRTHTPWWTAYLRGAI